MMRMYAEAMSGLGVYWTVLNLSHLSARIPSWKKLTDRLRLDASSDVWFQCMLGSRVIDTVLRTILALLGFVPIAVVGVLFGLELASTFLQSYAFAALSCIYFERCYRIALSDFMN
jgi:hypothetical protein